MGMTDKRDEMMLDSLFETARALPEPVSDGMKHRILRDAASVQHEEIQATEPTRTAPQGLAGWLWAVLGGWPAMGGLATAAIAGLWIGFSPALGIGSAIGDVMAGSTDGTGEAYLVDIDPLAALGLDYGPDYGLDEGDAG